MKYPATTIVHWVTGDVFACDAHARALIALSSMLGGRTMASRIQVPAECKNCINENEKTTH